MKKLFLFALTAGLALGMAGCVKGPNDGTDGPENGNNGKGKMKFAFTLPNQGIAQSRADGDPQEADSPDEVAVETISVFVFDADGVAATLGHRTSFPETVIATAFTKSNGDLTYTLNSDYYIETTSQNAFVFVAINLPASHDKDYATVEAMRAEINSVLQADDQTDETDGDFATAGAFTMFNLEAMGTPVTILPAGTTDIVTPVTVNVGRIASKVVATTQKAEFGGSNYQATDEAGEWNNGVELTYDILEFNVYQELTNSYAVYQPGKSVWTSMYDDLQSYFKNSTPGVLGTDAGANKLVTVYTGPAGTTHVSSAALAAIDGFYVAENYSKSNPASTTTESLNGTATYAMVATQVVSSKSATWTDTATTGTNGLVWGTTPTDTTDDLFIIYPVVATGMEDEAAAAGFVVDEPIIVVGQTEATQVLQGITSACELDATDAPVAGNVLFDNTATKMYKYPESYVHFLVWLNRDDVNDYNIGRNEFIHVNVTGVSTIDGFGKGKFPGYPGEEDDPKKPIDPTEIDPDKNPDPIIPDDPIEGYQAYLQVTVNILPWTYRDNTTILNR